MRADLAHEVLIQAWPTFVDWIRTWRSSEQRRRELEAAATAWHARGSGDGGLLDADEHAGAVVWREKAVAKLGHTPDLAAFLAASHAAQAVMIRQRRRRMRLAFITAMSFIAITSILALIAERGSRVARTARVWNVSWDTGTLADWRALRDRGDYYLNSDGVLVAKDLKVPASSGGTIWLLRPRSP